MEPKNKSQREKVKSNYMKPTITLLEFESEDIITASGGILDSADITGGSKEFLSSWSE